MQNIKNNNIGNSKLKNRPETVSNGSFERPPPTATVKAIDRATYNYTAE